MENTTKDQIFNLNEKLYQTIHLSRATAMAIDFFNQSCSEEGVEAVQALLRRQEEMLLDIYHSLDKLPVE